MIKNRAAARSEALRKTLTAGAFAFLASACGEADDIRRPADVEAEVSGDIETVVSVSWTTDVPSVGYVEYGPTKEMEFNTPLESKATKRHSVSLLGLDSDTRYHYRVVTWDGDQGSASTIETLRTGDLPGTIPVLTLDAEEDGNDQYVLTTVLGRNPGVLIINPEGRIVWYHTDTRELDFYRARLSLDGKSILYNAASVSGDISDASEIVRVSLDGSETTSIPIPLLAHDFVLHEDGTIGAMVVEYRDFDGMDLRGDTIVEIDEDGDMTTIWTSWDCFDPTEVRGDDIEHGWTFANALDYDEDEEAYYIGMRNFSSIAKVNRGSGECEWVFGSFGSTIDFEDGADRFLHQHQFQIRGDRILILDNDGSTGNESRVLEYELDLENNVARQIWSYVSDPSVYTFVLGEPIRLNDGDTFINWSAAGQMERVTEEEEVTWKLNSEAGFAFGFNTLLPGLYTSD